MATISVTSTYAGDALKGYILECLLGGETLSTNGISILTNVKYKKVIKKIGVGDIVQANSCDFTPTSGITLTEAILQPCKYMINEHICLEDIDTVWSSNTDMPAGADNDQIPADLLEGLTAAYKGAFAESIESKIWQSNVASGDCFDGYEVILTAGGVTGGTGTTLTVSNVVTILNEAYALVPACVLAKPKNQLVIFMSHKALALYEMNLATQGINTSVMGGVPTLYGIEIKAISGLSDDNIIVIGEKSNFYVGTDLADDYNQVRAIDLRESTGDEAINFVVRFRIDVAIAYPENVVFYNA